MEVPFGGVRGDMSQIARPHREFKPLKTPTATKPNDPPGVPARRAALKLLDAVLRQGLPLEAALGRATAGIERADDRALAHAIAAEVLRRLPDLDALIDSATPRALPEDAKARFVLRIALVQTLSLGTPAHAAIATVLPLVDGGPKKLVHGVFGALSRRGDTLPEIPALPDPVAIRWHAAWGDDMIEAAENAIAAPPPLDLTLADPAATAGWAERLGGTSLLPGHVRLDSAHVPELPGFEEGAWWVQDIAASLPARLIGRGEGTALDLCAAPGGKTAQLVKAGYRVTALDSDEARMERLRGNLQRLGYEAETVVADAVSYAPPAPFGGVLLDAPCSATGTFRRHPEVLWHRSAADVAGRVRLQRSLLRNAVRSLAPGGTLLYCVCSLEPAEGEAQVDWVLDSMPDLELWPMETAELAGLEQAVDGRGLVRTHPGLSPGGRDGGMDGFFVARFRRR
jgi:16S rRNA (cytosine967-C5)-methyltransferase